MRYLPLLVAIGLTIYATIDCARTPSEEVQHLPKPIWLLIVLLAWIVGPIAWLLAGRRGAAPGGGTSGRPLGPDDDPEFLRHLREQWAVPRDDERRRSEEQVHKDDENPDRPS